MEIKKSKDLLEESVTTPATSDNSFAPKITYVIPRADQNLKEIV